MFTKILRNIILISLLINKTSTEPQDITITTPEDQQRTWNGGYMATFIINNNSNHATKNWKIEFDIEPGQKIERFWGGELKPVKENHVIITSEVDWHNIKAKETANVGVLVSGGSKKYKNFKAEFN